MTFMSTVQEIQSAIEKLSLSERAELAKWFNGWEDDEWDREMKRDFGPGGRYKKVLEQVDAEIDRGSLRDLP